MDAIEARVKEMGYVIPAPPTPAGLYLPFRRHGDLAFLSGVICLVDGAMTHTGQVGEAHTVEYAQEAARVCALNAMAAMKAAAGSLTNVAAILQVNGFVNAVHGFEDAPLVINGASTLFNEAFGEVGQHSRAAVAVAGLPKGSTVELQVTIAVKS